MSWQLPTVLESAVVLVALARVGAVQNPIIPLLREQEVRHITGQIGTSLFLVPTSWRGFDHDAMARTIAKDAGFQVATVDLAGVPGPELRLPMGDPASLPAPPTGSPVGAPPEPSSEGWWATAKIAMSAAAPTPQ